MFVELDLQSEKPLYSQLVDQIVEGIAAGDLLPGTPLPSVRSLAADLGINLHTVNKAYQALKQEGFVQIHRKQGAVIQTGDMPQVTERFDQRLSDQLKSLAVEAAVRGMTEEQFVVRCAGIFRGIGISQRGKRK